MKNEHNNNDATDWKWMASFVTILQAMNNNNNQNNNNNNEHRTSMATSYIWIVGLILVAIIVFIILYFTIGRYCATPTTTGNCSSSANIGFASTTLIVPYSAVLSTTPFNPSQQLTYMSSQNMLILTAMVGGNSVTRIGIEKTTYYTVTCSLVFAITTSAITGAIITLKPEVIVGGILLPDVLFDQTSANTGDVHSLSIAQALTLDVNTTISLMLTSSQAVTVNIISWSVLISQVR